MDKFKQLFHMIGLWFLIIFLIGFFSGNWAMSLYRNYQMQEAKQLGAFIYEKQIYKMELRP